MNYLLFSFLAVAVAPILHALTEMYIKAYAREEVTLRLRELSLNPPQKKRQFFFITVFSLAGTLLLLHHFGTSPLFFWGLGLLYGCLILTFVDLDCFILPDSINLSLIAAGIAFAFSNPDYPPTLQHSLIGAAAGYGSLWLVNFLFKLLRNKEGMGGGDFKLFAAIGAWIGPYLLPLVIFIAASFGIVFAIIRAAITKDCLANPFPFGPALILGGFIGFLWGWDLLGWYVGLIS